VASVSHRGRVAAARLRVNAADFGVLPAASAATNTAGLQRAIDTVNTAGQGEVYIPDGTYSFARYSTSGWCLLLKSGVSLVGESRDGVILKQDASIAASVRLFYCTNAVGARVTTLTLDGNKANQTVNEHRHGMFIDGASDLVIDRVTSQNFSGDGFYVYLDADNVKFKNCRAEDNTRSGITIGRTCTNIDINSLVALDNGQQEIDFEPASTDAVAGVRIRNCTLGNPDGSDNVASYVVAIGGSASSGITTDVEFTGNTVYGSVFVVWAADVLIRNNTIIVSAGETPCIKVYRNCDDIRITDNSLQLTRTAHGADEAVVMYLDATGTDNQPDNVVVARNTLTLTTPCTAGPTCGIVSRGSRNITIEDNTITGAGGTAGAGYDGGIMLRANVACESWTVRRNVIRNFGIVGVKLYDTEAVDEANIDENTFSDTQATPTMVVGVDLYDGAENVATLACVDNVFSTGITTKIDYPPNVRVLTHYTHAGYPVYTGEAVPAFSLDTIGAIYIRVSTAGVVTATYEKRSTGTAGWTLVV
jgi:hypothetical protein